MSVADITVRAWTNDRIVDTNNMTKNNKRKSNCYVTTAFVEIQRNEKSESENVEKTSPVKFKFALLLHADLFRLQDQKEWDTWDHDSNETSSRKRETRTNAIIHKKKSKINYTLCCSAVVQCLQFKRKLLRTMNDRRNEPANERIRWCKEEEKKTAAAATQDAEQGEA